MGYTKNGKQNETGTKSKKKYFEKKRSGNKNNKRRARLVVRNLPFQTTEENLKAHFNVYGDIDEVKLLKTTDSQPMGCGFVQFCLVQKAAKARHHLNGKKFLDKELNIDWAKSKDKYLEELKKAEVVKLEKIEVKEEPIDVDEIEEVKVKEEVVEETVESKSEDSDNESERSSQATSSESESDDEDESNVSDDTNMIEKNDETEQRKPFVSNDVSEGKTIFIKNVPFSATNDDIKQCMAQFGPLYYALICIDKFTEHSKGSAFAKFKSTEDAEKCLQAGTELTLMGNILDCHRALNRNEIKKKHDKKKDDHKDSRNLYLVKEGVILAGSKAAEGVSASDMAKRLQLEQYKTQILRNLNMFVSRVRLIVHNLPPTWDDKKLRMLFMKHAGPNADIKEARVMRDMRNVDSKGIGKSKEHGFVTFTNHENAINALRALNNNPNVFSKSKRPVVAFSIENRVVLNARKKRMQQSRVKNPYSKEYDENIKKVDRKLYTRIPEVKTDFAGIPATPGIKKMRSKYNLKTQAKTHYEHLKKQKKRQKHVKKIFEQKKNVHKQPKQKIKSKKENDTFSKMVNDYKKKIMNVPLAKKTKWYMNDSVI